MKIIVPSVPGIISISAYKLIQILSESLLPKGFTNIQAKEEAYAIIRNTAIDLPENISTSAIIVGQYIDLLLLLHQLST